MKLHFRTTRIVSINIFMMVLMTIRLNWNFKNIALSIAAFETNIQRKGIFALSTLNAHSGGQRLSSSCNANARIEARFVATTTATQQKTYLFLALFGREAWLEIPLQTHTALTLVASTDTRNWGCEVMLVLSFLLFLSSALFKGWNVCNEAERSVKSNKECMQASGW